MRFRSGDVISYIEMCQAEGLSLHRGMNFHVSGGKNIILVSLRKGAPYEDKLEEDGSVLIYEGHDVSRTKGISDPKMFDQSMHTPMEGVRKIDISIMQLLMQKRALHHMS